MAFAIEATQSQTSVPSACEKESPEVQKLVTDAINRFDFDNAPAQSIDILKKILATDQVKELDGLCKAWVYQWLALCYDDLDSLEIARPYVIRSLKEDPEIWREHADSRLTTRLRKTYEESWKEIETDFMKKRRSWRVAIGPIARIEFRSRFGIAMGIGTTVISLEDTLSNDNIDEFNVNLFRDALLYLRIQKMRKTIERLMAGFYGEFSLSFPLKKNEWQSPDKAVSFGPIIGYAWQSGLEFGGTFEIARLVVGQGTTKISQTFPIGGGDPSIRASYANFEIYLRKWF
jgi:hypothetical protein